MTTLSGEELARHRRVRGLGQKELGEILGVSDRTISAWENEDYVPAKRVPFIMHRLAEWDLEQQQKRSALAAFTKAQLLAELLSREVRGAGEAGGEPDMPAEAVDLTKKREERGRDGGNGGEVGE